MPRKTRKKKCDASQWPPLTFVSSPLFQPAPVIEQEIAVTNPVTAKTVPIDDLTETVWVSPQFSQLGRRMLRSSLSTLRKINSASKSSGALSAGALSKRTKFKPLKFLCDTSAEEDPSAPRTKHLQPFRLETVLAEAGEKETVLAEAGEKETVLAEAGEKNCSLSEDPKQYRQLDPKTRGLCNNKENADETPERPNQVLRSNHCGSSGSHCQTRRKTRSSEYPQSKTPISCAPHDETDNLEQQQTRDESFETVPCPVSFIATPSRADTSTNEQSSEMNQPPTALNNNHFPSPLAINAKPSSFEKLRTKSHANFWHATPPRSTTGAEIVLALDTPVCDYGLGLRQRQLKYGLRDPS